VVTYIITIEDAFGRFTKLLEGGGERLMLREAKLPRLNFQTPLDLLAEKFHSSPCWSNLIRARSSGKRANRSKYQTSRLRLLRRQIR